MENLHLAIVGTDCLRAFRDGTSPVMEDRSKEEAL
jgi:hypothetical protein